MRLRLFVACILPLLALVSTPASAGPSAEKDFDEAVRLYEARRFSDALPKFESARAATKSPNASLYEARCLRELGRFVEAHARMKKTLADAASDPSYEKTRETAEKELAELATKVGFVRLAGLASAARPRSVSVAGVAVPEASWAEPVAVQPGTQIAVTVEREEGSSTKTVEVDTGATIDVDVAPKRVIQQTADHPPRAAARAPSPMIIGSIASFATGGVSLAVGTVLGSLALVRRSQGDDQCDGAACTQRGLDLHDESLAFANGANVTVAVGLAGVAAGVVLLLLAPKHAQNSRPALGAGPRARGGAVTWVFP